MKLAAYCRVSTQEQVQHGQGLDIQKDQIYGWASVRGHELVGWYSDQGISGSNGLEERYGLADALETLSEGVEGLVVARLDRLARDLILQEQLLAEVVRRGGQLFSVADSEMAFLQDDPDDPSRKLIRQILGAVSEFERASIRLRMRRGAMRKAAQGGYVGGRPPYGYRAVAKSLERDPETFPILCDILDWLAKGRSLHEVCRRLNAQEVPSAEGGRWWPRTIKRIADRMLPAYLEGQADWVQGVRAPS